MCKCRVSGHRLTPRDQVVLFPPHLDEPVREGSEVRLLDEAMESMEDWSGLEENYSMPRG